MESSITLVISTYNRPDALRLSLMSVCRQTTIPKEVIVADDGSGEATRKLVQEFQKTMPCPLKHAWHEDRGFRLAESRNNAVRNYCTGRYLIFVDGDIVMERHFIEDHARLARKGYFVCGSRVLIGEQLTRKLISEQSIDIDRHSKGLKRSSNAMRLPWLTFVTRHAYFYKRFYGRGANMAMWRDDFAAVNGFDSDISGWGFEDTDIIIRLRNLGLKRNYAKFVAIEYHLYHKAADNTVDNWQLYESSLKKIECANGLVDKRPKAAQQRAERP